MDARTRLFQGAPLSLQPATFAERGVSAPFTTPGLVGARVRQAPGQPPELVLPNPSGARGLYIVPWAGVRELCQPTLHDLHLHAVLGRGVAVSPDAMWAIAREVALGGSAGRAAANAALEAEERRRRQLQALGLSLTGILRDLGGTPPNPTELAALAGIIEGIGFGPDADMAGIPRQIARLAALGEALDAWGATHGDDAALTRAVRAAASLAGACAARAMEAARRAMGTESLTAAWRSRLDEFVALVARPAWILDGWSLPCLLWEQANVARSAALVEIARLVPMLPPEAQAWTGLTVDPAAAQAMARLLRRADTAATEPEDQDLVARNEHLRALAA